MNGGRERGNRTGDADHIVGTAPGKLLGGVIVNRRGSAAEWVLPGVSDDAYDLAHAVAGVVGSGAGLDAFADGVLTGKVLVREGAVDDEDGL